MVETPVLFETFVRTDYARLVFDAIKAAQPKKLYFYSNKGRADHEGEIERNEEIRSWVKEIDWDCELHTWFRDECVDVYTSLRGAISWLFDNEEAGIVLEDDCVPTQAFFNFCDQMIEKFRNDRRVWYVSGDNFANINPGGYDYIFSRYHWMYGWASWADRWHSIDWDNLRIVETVESGIAYQLYKTKRQADNRNNQILKFKEFVERTYCWDYIFGLCADQNNSLGVFPKKHLIWNAGVNGEHHRGKTQVSWVNIQPVDCDNPYEISNEPPYVFANQEYDYQLTRFFWNQKTFLQKIKTRVARFIDR